MENYCVGSRGEGFPAGLRVLVVDDDPTWLKILEKMLRKCFYEVTTCGLARTALDMLREKKDRFDIVISDVNMPDMDGFKLLEQVGLEMDLPVIMMSVDGETSRVMKGVQHGACDYLLKPVRMKELRNIWQHVFRKKIHEMKEVESHDSNELNDIRNKLEEFNEWQILSGGDVSSGKKRKDVDKEYIEQDFADAASVKKARVVWSVDLHQKFVNAVNQIGFDKVGPKKILDLMNVPGLTRENVASHLQKYRLYLIRLQKQNEGRTLGEIVQSDISSTDSPGKFGVHSSITKQKSNSPNSCGSPGTRMHYEDMIQSTCVEDLKNVASFQVTDTRKAINNGTTEFLKLNNVSEFGVVTSSKERILGLDYDCNDSCISKQYQYGTDRNTTMQLMKQDQESSIYMKAYSQLQQLCEVHHLRDNQLHTPPVHALTSTAGEDGSPTRIKSTITFGSNHARNLPFACNIDLVSSQIEHRVMNTYHLEAASSVNCHRSTEAYSYGVKNSGCSPDSPSQNLDLKAEADLSPLDDLLPYSLPNYGRFESFGLNCLEVSEYNRQMPTTDIQINLCDELQYNSEYPFDLLEFPPLDDGLFT